MNNNKHAAIYVRVSTTNQDHKSQLPDLKRWAENHEGPVQWHRDKFTGKTMDRPGMSKLMEAFYAGKLERIVVWRLDRLGRTCGELCRLFDELRARKVDLVSIRDGFNLASPSGRLHARILASVAEFENEVRSERVQAGIAAAKAKGKRWGGSKPGWHWRVKPEHKEAILKMARDGEKITKIARVTQLAG
jgi:DNA invertase Pin-like site-specific DNA recombinase